MSEGRVYLVGAGPGDPGLITRRGLELLRSCDVVLYDRLVAPALLEEAPARADIVFVGKSAEAPSIPQAGIDALVASHARAGKKVVRLKGGDPFVFGRGADEAQALVAAGIPFEIVPGVTSAVAVPAYAGIPLTHSGASSSFTVMTAHESSTRPTSEARRRELAVGADTLVLLMGVGAIRDMVAGLIDAGRPPEEPCAVIEWGTTARQRVVVGRLSDIAELVEEAEITPPATTVVGEVVRLSTAIDWFSTRPLLGKRVVVTRARADAGKLGRALEEAGAEALFVPTIGIEEPPSWDELDLAIAELHSGGFDWVVFSSAHAVEKLFSRLAAAGLDARSFAGSRIAAVGSSTERALVARGIRADLIPDSFTGEALVRAMGPGRGTVLLPRPAAAPRAIVDSLEEAGWRPREATAYVNVPVAKDSPAAAAVREGRFDAITFTSASTVRNFVDAVGKPRDLGLSPDDPADRTVACIGPATSSAAEELGFRVDVVADDHTIEGLIAALVSTIDGS